MSRSTADNAKPEFSEKELQAFLEFSESLKHVRKATVEFDGENIINEIYTDLLPNNGVLSRVNRPRTTILVGRKGTGKSTILQKSQLEVERRKEHVAIYMDVKALHESAKPELPPELIGLHGERELIKYFLYTNLIHEIIAKTKVAMKAKLNRSWLMKWSGLGAAIQADVEAELNAIEESTASVFRTINGQMITSFKNIVASVKKENAEAKAGVDSEGISFGAGASQEFSDSARKEFDSTMIKYLDLRKCLIESLWKIRDVLGIKRLYIYLDDYSEVDRDEQELFMDWFVAPMNNLSDEFVKFKIAAYPKRFHFGKLDRSKVDEISIDFFDAYNPIETDDKSGISGMERLALDYTSRLIENRTRVFFKDITWSKYFDMKKDELSMCLFMATINVPRKMGYLLSYCYESSLIQGKKINAHAIANAASRYYNDVIEKHFIADKIIFSSFDNKINAPHQLELLSKIVERLKKIQGHREGRAKDASHFYVKKEVCYLFDTLELNGFMTTYNEVVNGDGAVNTVFSLDHGLCNTESIEFARPQDPKTNSQRHLPVFNFTGTVLDYFNSTQVIRCANNHEFSYSEIHEFKKYGMKCPECIRDNVLTSCNVESKFPDFKRKFEEEESHQKITISFPQYLVLQTFNVVSTSITVRRIAESLDWPFSRVEATIAQLVEMELCEVDVDITRALSGDYFRSTAKGQRLGARIDQLVKKAGRRPES